MWGFRRRVACGEPEIAWAFKLLICESGGSPAMVSTFSIHASI